MEKKANLLKQIRESASSCPELQKIIKRNAKMTPAQIEKNMRETLEKIEKNKVLPEGFFNKEDC